MLHASDHAFEGLPLPLSSVPPFEVKAKAETHDYHTSLQLTFVRGRPDCFRPVLSMPKEGHTVKAGAGARRIQRP